MREQGIEVTTAQVRLADDIARPWTYEKDPCGELGVVADAEQDVLVGAWAVGPLAGEWIHHAALAIKGRVAAEVAPRHRSPVPNVHTEGYLMAIERLGR